MSMPPLKTFNNSAPIFLHLFSTYSSSCNRSKECVEKNYQIKNDSNPNLSATALKTVDWEPKICVSNINQRLLYVQQLLVSVKNSVKK